MLINTVSHLSLSCLNTQIVHRDHDINIVFLPSIVTFHFEDSFVTVISGYLGLDFETLAFEMRMRRSLKGKTRFDLLSCVKRLDSLKVSNQ